MNNNTFVHKYIKGLINKNDICVDMTMGNGNDTYFLATISKKVIAFDINEEAIKNTKEKTKSLNNVILIKDNHININKYLDYPIDLFIFNLGYLPNSKDKTITKANETLIAFKKAYSLLKDNGYLIITFYRGHKGGKDEYYLLKNYFEKEKINTIEKYKNDKDIDEPYTYIIKKKENYSSFNVSSRVSESSDGNKLSSSG